MSSPQELNLQLPSIGEEAEETCSIERYFEITSQLSQAPGSLPKGLSENCGFEDPKMTISLSKIADLRPPEGEIFENTVRICGFEAVVGTTFFKQVHLSI